MTEKQRQQFNQMASALRTIAKDYYTPDGLRKNAEKIFGCSFPEALEMSYDNIQIVAKNAARGVKYIKALDVIPLKRKGSKRPAKKL